MTPTETTSAPAQEEGWGAGRRAPDRQPRMRRLPCAQHGSWWYLFDGRQRCCYCDREDGGGT